MRRKGERGVTLTEMLVVLAIISMFAFITIPAFRDFMNAFKVRSTAFQIRDVVRLGRQRAVAKKRTVAAEVVAGTSEDASYDAWEDLDNDQVQDPTEGSIRPVPPVPRFVDIVGVYSDQGQLAGGVLNLAMASDGSISRPACADPCAEAQWCVQVEMQINSTRTDRYTVLLRQSGKANVCRGEQTGDVGFCTWTSCPD